MKVVSAQEMARIEQLAYVDGAEENEFMVAAGTGVAEMVMELGAEHNWPLEVTLLCGKGNNAGDAYVAGKILAAEGYIVRALQLFPIGECSKLCQLHHELFVTAGGEVEYEFSSPRGIVLDALFGTGFSGSVKAPLDTVINSVNSSNLPVVSIDIPSGLDGSSGEIGGTAIRATATVGLGLPKSGYFLNEGWDCIGHLHMVDFGLSDTYIQQGKAEFELVDEVLAKTLLPAIKPSRHKYEAGVVVGVAGSSGMGGAAQLASAAALRSGCGLMRLMHPEGMEVELSNTIPEVIQKAFNYESSRGVLEALDAASASFIGPGIGQDVPISALLSEIFQEVNTPCVIDADALSIAARDGLSFPKGAVITPHTGELRRLLEETETAPMTLQRLQILQDFCAENEVCLIVKGGPTFVIDAHHGIFVCPRGTPGMATAGTGDVLTGVITALLAQGLSAFDAARLGVFIHGRAGEIAAVTHTPYSMVASDLIAHLGDVFEELIL